MVTSKSTTEEIQYDPVKLAKIKPTKALCGSDEKITELRRRESRKLPLFHPQDNQRIAD